MECCRKLCRRYRRYGHIPSLGPLGFHVVFDTAIVDDSAKSRGLEPIAEPIGFHVGYGDGLPVVLLEFKLFHPLSVGAWEFTGVEPVHEHIDCILLAEILLDPGRRLCWPILRTV